MSSLNLQFHVSVSFLPSVYFCGLCSKEHIHQSDEIDISLHVIDLK